MSSHIFYLGAFEAERAVAEGVRGAGPDRGAIAPAPARRPDAGGAPAKARTVLGAAIIRVGEAVRGPGRLGSNGRPLIEPGCGGQA